jgi:hypothetical protein
VGKLSEEDMKVILKASCEFVLLYRVRGAVKVAAARNEALPRGPFPSPTTLRSNIKS